MQGYQSLSKSIHWIVCCCVALSATFSVWFFAIPLCWGCLATQFLLWFRLILQSKRAIGACLIGMLGIQGTMLYFSTFELSLTCPFDGYHLSASCQAPSGIIFLGYSFMFWSFLGTLGLMCWSLIWRD